MRFLLDENVNTRLTAILQGLGHDAGRVPPGTKNGEVAALALKEGRVLITHDSDFSDSERFPPPRHSGIIFVNIRPRNLEKLREALSLLLSQVPPDRLAKGLFLVEDGKFSEIV